VIVASIKTGLEVVHLYTGRPLCRLILPDLHTGGTYGSHADTNNDGVVDQILAVIDKPEKDVKCYALALTGVPTVDELWNGTVSTTNNHK